MAANYRARLTSRDDNVDPWPLWPRWDVHELEDNLELWLEPPDADDEQGNALREHLPKALRERSLDDDELLAAYLERMVRTDLADARSLLAAMTSRDTRAWQLDPADPAFDEDACIAMRERLITQNLLARAFPERFAAPRVTTLTAVLTIIEPSAPLTITREVESFALRVLADADRQSALTRWYGDAIFSGPAKCAREIVVTASFVDGNLTITLPTHLVPGVKARAPAFDTWAFDD